MLHNQNDFSGQGYRCYPAGLIAPMVILLDNDFDSVKSQKDFLVDNGFTTLVTSKATVAREAFFNNGNSAAYLFDMHMRSIRKIGKVDTCQGLTVGTALISDITNNGKENHITHCATLTEHDAPAEARRAYTVLKKHGQTVTQLSKDKFDQFEKFINLYREDYINNIKPNIVNKNIIAVEKAFSELSDSTDVAPEIAAMLGYTGADVQLWIDKREEIAKSSGRDLQDRIESLYYIKQGIYQHFDGNIENQKKWIHKKRIDLGDKSAWEHLTTGDMDGVNTVATFVNKVIG